MSRGIKGTGIGLQTYNCLCCGKENNCGRTKTNKFCNNVCQAKYKWENETVPRIKQGLLSAGAPALKRYIIETQGEVCSECGQTNSWNSKPLMLQLDHIDGNSDNNLPSNLRILCPNCHTQTETHGSKGKGSRYKKETKRNTYLREYKRTVA